MVLVDFIIRYQLGTRHKAQGTRQLWS